VGKTTRSYAYTSCIFAVLAGESAVDYHKTVTIQQSSSNDAAIKWWQHH